jgi:cytochrome bd-type quinol oxidase subunit 1
MLKIICLIFITIDVITLPFSIQELEKEVKKNPDKVVSLFEILVFLVVYMVLLPINLLIALIKKLINKKNANNSIKKS